MSQLSAIDLRKGMLVMTEGRMASIVHWNIWKSDRRSRIQMRFKDILTGRVTEETAQSDDRYQVLESEVIDLEHSYRDGNEEVFYAKDGEEHRCIAAAVEDVLKWASPNYRGLMVDGALVTVTVPQYVTCTVADTSPAVKGVPNAMKDAVLDNGMTVKVSGAINIGDKVRIDTETMEYKDRVS